MAERIPERDNDFRVWATDFHNACSGNLTVLGITSPQLTAMYDKLLDYDTQLAAVTVKKNDAKGQVGTKDVAKRTLRSDVSELIKIIRTRDVPVLLLDQLGIGPIDPHSPVHPQPPGILTVRPDAMGTNWLKWERGANKRGTQYVVQVMNDDTEGFVYVTTATRLSFKHTGQQPGFQQTYRVVPLRNGQIGLPSNQFTVYGPEQSGQVVQLKAA